MKLIQCVLLLFVLFATVNRACAFDSACEPILAAGEARSRTPAWHSLTVINDSMKIEYMKSGTAYFMRSDGGSWKKAPSNIEQAERNFAGQVRSDKIKMTDCKNEGSQTVAGVDVEVISYTVEMAGVPPSSAKLSIGKLDRLPYALSSKTTNVVYRYRDIETPK